MTEVPVVEGLGEKELETPTSEFFREFSWEPSEPKPEDMSAEEFLAGLDDGDAD